MQNLTTVSTGIILSGILVFSNCNEKKEEAANTDIPVVAAKNEFNGFENQVKWGEHLVNTSGCNDCHTPKKMSPMGPVNDSSLILSGHPEKLPVPNVNRKEMESKGLIVTQTLTAWVGPWGISYAGNLTPDSTGIGNWKESQFIYALRNGVFKGIPGNRPILPPMPWEQFKNFTDGELGAIFSYLKSIKPINNKVPAATPPASAPPPPPSAKKS